MIADSTYDVCIVGAGPGGATCAYYLACAGHRVLLLDRCQFPRDKICGDAIVPRAQVHLKRMGLLPRLITEGRAKPALVGGFVSPAGREAIGGSHELIGDTVLSIKRRVLDEQLVRTATAAGADFVEGCTVETAEFSCQQRQWRILCHEGRSFVARALVAADGANSRLARRLGFVKTRPTAVCSRSYVATGSHECDMDGICVYPRKLLPGYAALFREADGDLNLCCYILPGGRCRPNQLRQLHDWLKQDDPTFRRLLGPRPQFEPMRSAPLRIGGIDVSYGDHFLIVGDAAGQIDPLTGEGIQYAMDAGQFAANTVSDGFAADDLSRRRLRKYHRDWRRSFGNDFRWSSTCAWLLTRQPRLLDVAADAVGRSGDQLLKAWAGVMTGSRPKSHLLHPTIAWSMILAMARQRWRGT